MTLIEQLEELAKWCDDESVDWYEENRERLGKRMSDAAILCRQAISELKAREWISVKDRMPDKDCYVLIVMNDSLISRTWFSKEHGFFEHTYGVSHWMLMPEKP